MLFREGSPAGKLLVRTEEVEAAGDSDFEAAMLAHLFEETVEIATPTPERDPEWTLENVKRLRQLDRGVAVLCLLVAAGLPFFFGKWPGLSWLYLLPAMWLLVNAQATAINGGKAFAELSVPAHATRWGMMVALAFMISRNPRTDRLANWVLRIGCALTFAIHGWEAWQLNPSFQDLLYGTARNIGIDFPEAVCHALLRIIGAMDVLLATTILAFHLRPLLFWMGCWGLITAASRPLAMGIDAWPEFAMRLPNSAVPLLVLFLGLPALFQLSSTNTRPQEPANS